jgi:hypothetical protein
MSDPKSIIITIPKGAELAEIGMTLERPSDCCDDSDLGQDLQIKTCDGGGGKFLVIKTERWAFDGSDEIDAFCESLKSLLAQLDTKP